MTRSLPKELDELRGLRVARWLRESTKAQEDNFGLDAQRAQQDRAIERYGLTDTGIEWQVTHSGYRTAGKHGVAAIASSEKFADMLARAGTDYDVLLVGYMSRLVRDPEVMFSTARQLHAAGAAILACDEGILSSDDREWDRFAREAVEAKSYSKRLGRRIAEGYEAKWRRYTDPAGHPPPGYRRASEKPYLLEVDPEAMPAKVALFERRALGTVSLDDLEAESGINRYTLSDMFANPTYKGIVSYKGETGYRADLRMVSDDLWEQVQAAAVSRRSGGGPARPDRVDHLERLLVCSDPECAAIIGRDGYGGRAGKQQRRHRNPCTSWGPVERKYNDVWLMPILAQVMQITYTRETEAQVTAALSEGPAPRRDDLAAKRLDRERKALREAWDAGTIGDDEFMARSKALRAEEVALTARQDAPETVVTPEEALAYIRDLPRTFAEADEHEQRDLLHAIYQRIEVQGPEFIAVHLTPEAEAHGLALALPESVSVSCCNGRGERI